MTIKTNTRPTVATTNKRVDKLEVELAAVAKLQGVQQVPRLNQALKSIGQQIGRLLGRADKTEARLDELESRVVELEDVADQQSEKIVENRRLVHRALERTEPLSVVNIALAIVAGIVSAIVALVILNVNIEESINGWIQFFWFLAVAVTVGSIVALVAGSGSDEATQAAVIAGGNTEDEDNTEPEGNTKDDDTVEDDDDPEEVV